MRYNPFESTPAIGNFEAPNTEYQVTIEPASDLGDAQAPDEVRDVSERSFKPYVAFFGVVLVLLGLRLVNLQVTKASAFQVLAKGNRVETRFTQPPRGVIVDRKSRDLVKNTPAYSLELYPAQLPKTKSARELIYQQVEQITGIKQSDIIGQVDIHGLNSLEPITLKADIDRDTALMWQIKLATLSGISMTRLPSRSYDNTLGLSHLLGYIGKITEKELKERDDLSASSFTGKAGLESAYDSYLQGKVGREEAEVDSKGRIQRVVSSEVAEPGNILNLYLDKDLQAEMAAALLEGAEKAGRKKGVAIAIDPRNGGILGMVSLPSYDNNVFTQTDKADERKRFLNDKDQPLFNRAIAGAYPPGSTTKPIWAAAGLQEGLINEKTNIQTPAQITVGSSVFPDWKPHGNADVKKAIAESNNIFFYALAGGYDKIKGMGPTKMKEYAQRFGWGSKTNIDLPGEAKGLVPDPAWKKEKLKEGWYIGDTYHIGIGQGYLSLTPLQIANSITPFANGGTLYEPRLVKEIKSLDGVVIASPGDKVIRKDVVSSDTIRIVREGMRQTILEGTARPLNEIPMAIAGKTGTAQFEEKDKTHAWFVGFAPYENPEITLLVMIEGGGESFDVAVPIAKRILTWYSIHGQEVQRTE